MDFYILGPLEIAAPGSVPQSPGALKQRALLAMLCLSPGRTVSTRQLTEALWPDGPPRTAGTALQVYVSRLRKFIAEIGGDPLTLATRAPGYLFDLRQQHTLDLDRFESAVAEARRLSASGRTEEASDVLAAGIALWRGPALADVRTLPVLDGLGRQLDEKRTSAYELRVEIELRLGRHAEMISELYGLLTDRPLWENLHFYLMVALYRSGRTADALGVYNTLRKNLVEGLGMEPSSRLRQTQHAVLARESWLEDVSALPMAC
ncbi:BTAD domain-containing putative transcriptional regulator [Kitasatospora sp. NPDC059571]|uniref:AfsR/SARP family transcriptional regulator n=1 Tax=Kitasatospora sp. NPDC059571 TaxID=3346871 RepID=UPI0036BCAB27